MPQSGDLYIRYSATDHGERDIPAGTKFWESPAIHILGSGLGAGVAVADRDQKIRVFVGNRNAQQAVTDAWVQVFATDWGPTNPWLDSVGGETGREIGPQTIVANARSEAGSEGVFQVDWRPDSSELGGAQRKHMCLLANCFAADDGAPQSVPPVFTIQTDQHHAQRNVTLSAAPPEDPMQFAFHAANMGEDGGAFLLGVVEVEEGWLDPVEALQVAGTDWLGPVQDRLGEPLEVLEPSGDVLVLAQGKKGEQLELSLDAGEQVRVSLRAGPSGSRKPGLRRFSIVQRSLETEEIVGGALLMMAAVPKELIPEPLLDDGER